MRVVIVSQHFPPENSGNASRVSDMAEKMAAQGVDVTVLAPHPTFPTGSFPRAWRWRNRSKWHGAKLINLWSWQPQAKDPGFLSRVAYYLTFPIHATLWAIFNARSYDVIVGSTPPVFTGMPGIVVRAIFRNKKIVVEVRDLWIDAAVSLGFVKEGSLFTRLGRRFERRAFLKAHLIAVTTDDVAAKIRARGETRAPIVVVPNGVDATRFRPLDGAKKTRFLYAGNIGHAQDLETVIAALAIVREKHPEAELVLAGGGDTAGSLKSFAAQKKLGDAVHFPGNLSRDEVARLYSTSIAGLAPLKALKTLEYAVPTKAYEAMACGVPYLGTGVGEIERLAIASSGGIVAKNTAEDVARVMAWLIEHPSEAAAMGKAGRAYVEARYDRAGIATNYVAALRGVLDEG